MSSPKINYSSELKFMIIYIIHIDPKFTFFCYAIWVLIYGFVVIFNGTENKDKNQIFIYLK